MIVIDEAETPGTPTFFDDRRGVKGLEPLYDRIKFESFGGVASLRQPQLDLKPFDRDRLVKVALRVRSLHPDLTPEEAETRISRAFIEQLADKVTEGFRGDVGVVPSQFLRTFHQHRRHRRNRPRPRSLQAPRLHAEGPLTGGESGDGGAAVGGAIG